MPNWKGIVGRGFRPQEFKDYVATLSFGTWRPDFVVLHNTSAPRLSQWHSHPGAVRMRNLENYYRDEKRWSAGPHLFIADDLIWVFTPLTTSGVHSPTWNGKSWGVEMVGEYDEEPFNPGVRENTVDALATLHAWRGIPASTLRFHKEDPRTSHTHCPGRNVDKSDLIARIEERMASGPEGEHQPQENYLEIGAKPTADARYVSGEMTRPADTYELQSSLLSTDPILRQVAATDLVLLPPEQSRAVDGIATIQRAINRLATVSPDIPQISFGQRDKYLGFYGPQTVTAIKALQTAAGISVDGAVGDESLKALDAALLKLEARGLEEAGMSVEPRPPREQQLTSSARARTKNGKGASETSGLRGEQIGMAMDAVEDVKAMRDGKSLGAAKSIRQIRTVDGDRIIVLQPNYVWGDRTLPEALLFLNHDGFPAAKANLNGEASYFGKYDPEDEGTGSPAYGTVQTNSSVFGVALPKKTLLDFGLAEGAGRNFRATPKGLSAMIEVYNPATKRLARVPIVDVGPASRTKRPADLTVATAAFLQDEREEQAKGYKMANIQVGIRIA